MKRTLPALLLALLSCAPAQAQEAARFAPLQPVIERFMADNQIPGLAIAVLQDGKLAYAAGFGVSKVGTDEKVTPRTVFALGANAGPFRTTAVMQLVERGKIELDAPVVRYLPYFELRDGHHVGLTVRHLLSGTAAFPEVRDWAWDRPEHDEGALERYVRGLKDVSLKAPPGTRFSFDGDIAAEVLGDIVAKVSGMSFEDYLRVNIFEPLALKDTTALVRDADPALLASPHVVGNGYRVRASDVFPYNRRHGPSSTRYSSVVDMARWAQAHLNRGELDGKRILDAATYDIMWARASDKSERRALGWWQRDNARVVFQQGQDLGFTSFMLLLPRQQSTAVVLLMNSNTGLASGWDLVDIAIDVAFGHSPRPVAFKPSIGQALYQTITTLGTGRAVTRYQNLKQTHKDTYDFGPRELNALGYMLLGEGRIAEAVRMFELNVDAHAEASAFWDGIAFASVYDGLGDAYLWRGDKARATSAFEKSLSLDPSNIVAATRLKALKEGN
jgi:CubicO group peptidase (beta-lactamase class C family)